MQKGDNANVNNDLFLHADGDAFFVACELTKRPELKGKPVIVGGDSGIAVAMSPEAKRIGVTRGIPVFQIKKLYPEVVILDHDFPLYHKIKEGMHKILSSYARTVEEYSIDECFALVKPSEIKYFGTPKDFMLELKNEIEKTLGVTYSLGLARTKALAKQASKLEKPNGLVILLSKEDEINALKRTPIDDIWGIGRQTVPDLKRLGMKTAYDFVNYSSSDLEKYFSKSIEELHRELSGESVYEVEGNADPRDQKSIQSTSTFRPSSSDFKIIWREVAKNVERACEHSREILLLTNKVSFFLKDTDFKHYFGDIKLAEYTADPGVILNKIEKEVEKLVPKKKKIRSTGIILHNLIREEKAPLDLFGRQEKSIKTLIIEETADKIRKKYGKDAIKRVSSLDL